LFKHIRKSSLSLVLISSLVLFAGCGDIENSDENIVESTSDKFSTQFISAEVIDDITPSVMLSVVNSAIDPTATNAFGYKAIKITYNTKGQNDEDIVASGLLVIPTASGAYQAYRASKGETPFSVSMICDNHGTILTNAEAPSNVEVKDGLPNYPLAVSMTGYAGFAGVYPDYIGYGESNDENHPYMLKKASARASLDMIKASMKYMADENIPINRQLYISGYSQGGYTAMALAQEVESSFSDSVNLMGVAPMAGPYLVDAFGDATIQSNAIMGVPGFLAFLVDSYTNAYENLTLQEMVVEEKVSAFDGLFDGSNSLTEVHVQLGMGLNTPINYLLQDNFISDYESTPTHEFREALKENNVGNWAAKSKIKLIHCTNDDVVPVAMTNGIEYILNSMGASSVEKLLIDTVTADYTLGESVHSNCAIPAYQQTIGWFNAIRSGDIK